jgi:hypothetical protein
LDLKDIMAAVDAASPSDKKKLAQKLKIGGAGGGRGGDYAAQAAGLDAYIKQLDKVAATEETIALKLKAKQEFAEAELNVIKQKIAAGQADDTIFKDLKAKQDALLLAEQEIDLIRQKAARVEEVLQASNQLGASIGNALAPFEKSPIFNFANLNMFVDAMQGGAAGMVDMVKSGFVGFIEGVIGGFIKATFAVDEFESSIGRMTQQFFPKLTDSTDTAREFAREMREGANEMANYYVTMEDYGEAAGNAWRNVSELAHQDADLQRSLANSTSALMLWGASADDVSGAYQNLNKVVGMSLDQVGQSTIDIASLAVDINVPIDQIMSDLNNMLPSLAKLGPTAVDSFKDLAIQSKRTGLEIQKILNLTDQFDTFEGAAEMSGQLNAALGGNFVNAMDMMTETDPVKRFEQMTDAIDQAGLSFDDMSYYQRQFFANAMGLESVQDLAMMMSGDMSALGSEVNMTSRDYEDMAKAAAKQATLQEKFDAALQEIMQTLVEDGLLDDLHQMFDDFRQGKGPLVAIEGAMKAVAEVFKMIAPLITLMVENPIISLFIIGTITAINVVGAFVERIGTLRDRLGGTTDKMAELSEEGGNLADRLNGGAEATDDFTTQLEEAGDQASGAQEDFENLFTDTEPPDPEPITDFGDATEEAGGKGEAASGGLMKMAIAVLAIGAGIGLAAAGMALFVGAFEGFSTEQIYAIVAAIGVFLLGMALMVFVLLKFAPAALLAGGTMSAAFTPLALVMLSLGAAMLMAGAGMAIFVRSFKDMSAEKITAIAGAIGMLGIALLGAAAAVMAFGNPIATAGLATLTGVILLLNVALGTMVAQLSSLDANILAPLGAILTVMSEGVDSTVSSEFTEIARVLKDDMDFDDISDMGEMLRELKSASDSVGTLARTSTSSSGNQSVQVELSLDAAATTALLNGEAVTAIGQLTQSGFGN